MITKEAKPYPGDITYLTSLRIFAAVSIVLFHFFYEFPFFTVGEGVIGRLYIGVDFFFILSGFILTHAYLSSMEGGTFSAVRFYIKRLARVYPVHFVTLMIPALFTVFTVFVWGLGYDKDDSISCFMRSLFLINAWGLSPDLCFNDVSWSISAEWFAYLLFPIVLPLVMRCRRYWLFLFASFLFIILDVLSILFFPDPLTQFTWLGFIRITPDFLMGVGLYLLGREYRLSFYGHIPFFILVVAIFLSLHFPLPDAVVVFLFCGIIFMAAEQVRQGQSSWLGSQFLIYWGEASYSVYMLHYVIWKILVIPVLFRAGDGSKIFDMYFWSAWGLAFFLLFLLSHLSYRYLEWPARAWICRTLIKKT